MRVHAWDRETDGVALRVEILYLWRYSTQRGANAQDLTFAGGSEVERQKAKIATVRHINIFKSSLPSSELSGV